MAIQPFSENLRFLVAKIETTPGTPETLTSADFDIAIKDPGIGGPTVEMDDESSHYARGDHAEHISYSGKQSMQFTFSFPCAWSGTVDVAPSWAKFHYACGYVPVTYAGTGFGLQRKKSYDNKTMTMWMYDVQLGPTPKATVYKIKGAMGNVVTGAANAVAPWMHNYTFDGALYDIDDNVDTASIPVLNNIDSTCSDKWVNSTFVINSVERNVSTWEFDTGNTVTALEDQNDTYDTGYEAFYLTSSSPMLSCNPIAIADGGDYNLINAGYTGCPTTPTIQLTSEYWSLNVPKAQMLSIGVGSRDSFINWDENYKACANGVTGSVIDSDLDPEVTAELLQGSRS